MSRLGLRAVLSAVLILAAVPASERLTSRPRPPAPESKPLPIGEELRTATGQKRRAVLPDGSVLLVNQQTRLTITARRSLKLEAGEVVIDAVPGKDRFVLMTPRNEVRTTGAAFAVRASDAGTEVAVTRARVEVIGAGEKAQAVDAGQRLDAAGKRTAAPRASHMLAWARDLMIAAESPLVPASAHSGGAITVIDPNGQEAKLSLRKYHIDVHIEDGFVRTTIDQAYFNHTSSRLEGTFHFPLPADASLSRLAMYVDGQRMEGGMIERERGRNVYETIVTKQQDPALLEWVDGTTFKMRVFPLEPRQEKRIVLSYTQKLASLYDQETYRFPVGHSLDAVRAWSLHVRLKGGKDTGWSCPSHSLREREDKGDRILEASAKDVKLDRDLVLNLSTQTANRSRFSTFEQDGARYLMVRHRPELSPRDQGQRGPRDWVFLFESSGDREPLLARAQVEIIRGLLQNAGPDDTFAVLAAGTRTRSPMKERRPVTPENVAEALGFLESAHLIGALDLDRALTDAGAFVKDGRDTHLVHVGSGIPAMGEQKLDVLVKRIPEDVRYVGVGVGRRWNRALMKAAAERSGGWFTQVNPDEPITWRTFELASILNTPRLLDVSVSDGAKNRWLPLTGVVTQGEEVCAVTRLEGELPESVQIHGTLDGKPETITLPVRDMVKEAGYLPRTWAKLEIERLLTEDAVKHKSAIVALSKAMYVMCPYTSLLVLENEAMYQQYKVDRGRKDHWAIYDCPEKIDVVAEDEDGNRIDARKGAKPSVKQVLDTIFRRTGPAPILTLGGKDEGLSGKPLSLGGVAGIAFDAEGGFPPAAMWGAAKTSRSEPRFFGVVTASELAVINGSEDSIVLKAARSGPDKTRQISQLMKQYNEYQRFGKYREAEMYARAVEELDPEATLATAAFRVARTTPRLAVDRERANHALYVGTAPLSEIGLPGRGFLDIDGSIGGDSDLVGLGYSMPTVFLPTPTEPIDSSALRYRRASYSTLSRLYADLVSYAPGMNTSAADILAVLETEARLPTAHKPGQIDEGARKLIDTVRSAGWRTLTVPADGDTPSYKIIFDGTGRCSYERTLFPGIRERVVCDGTTLWHLYPDLHIGATRSVSRFHRLAFAQFVPQALPRPEDLARGADVILADERTVAIVPHGVDGRKNRQGKPLSHVRLHLLFDPEGRMIEQRLVEMPARKPVGRILLSVEGGVRMLDDNDKETLARKTTLADAKAPKLKPDVKDLVILPLPYRSREHVLTTRKLKDRPLDDIPFDDALALLAADFASGNGDNLSEVYRRSFYGRDQRQLGFYVLLAAAGINLDAQGVDVLAEHRDEPLAQYLALHTSPVLRQHASQWAVASAQWGDGFLRHLAVTHAIMQRWQTVRVLEGTRKQRNDVIAAALAYIEKNRNSPFGFALLTMMTDRADEAVRNSPEERELREALARGWPWLLKTPGLEDMARYEQARALFLVGKRGEGCKVFLDLHDAAQRRDALLLFDNDLHRALLGTGGAKDSWNPLVRDTARRLIEKKQRGAILALARQCWAVGDPALAQDLLGMALVGVEDRKERLTLSMAVIDWLREHGKTIEAERLLQPLLEDAEWSKRADLWRLAERQASRSDQPAREIEYLEKALDAEYRDRPEVMSLETIDSEYGRLLEHYQKLAEAMLTLKVKPPEDFLPRVVKTADRWRALSRNGNRACNTAARILRQLGEGELAWDYLTTPVAQQPGESAPWVALAGSLRKQNELGRADEAYASAFAAEPTNAQILWDRAQNLRQGGRVNESSKLLRQLAEGDWQPRFASLVAQARWQLEQR